MNMTSHYHLVLVHMKTPSLEDNDMNEVMSSRLKGACIIINNPKKNSQGMAI